MFLVDILDWIVVAVRNNS